MPLIAILIFVIEAAKISQRGRREVDQMLKNKPYQSALMRVSGE
jgi:hypothetical protein